MKVYEFEGFPNPARIRIALAEKNLADQVEFVQIDVPGGEHQTAAFLEYGTTISECTAITEYLDHVAGEPTRTGRTPQERAVISMMQRRAEAGVLDAVSTYFHHATPGLGPDIEGYQCAEWGDHQRDRALAGMAYLDGVLAARPYLAGDAFSVADITAFIGLGFADFAKIEIPEEYGYLAAWRERVAARPSIAA
jgi:glutathione S-transferase